MKGCIVPKSYAILSDAVADAIEAYIHNNYPFEGMDPDEEARTAEALHSTIMLSIEELFHFPDLDLNE